MAVIKVTDRQFECSIRFVDWWQISCGITIDLRSPNLEIHLPLIFIKLGWSGLWHYNHYYLRSQKPKWRCANRVIGYLR